jgi:microcystin degradation protein MlrC
MHESNTFSPVFTNLDTFKRTQLLEGNELIKYHAGRSTEIGGILSVLEKNRVTVFPLISAVAMTQGMVTPETYQELKSRLLNKIKAHLKDVDGVLLVMHGAMTVERLEDPEGDVLSSVRGILPESTYLASTLDHHANVTETMINNSDFVIGYRTHPHIDQFEVGCKAASLILKLINEKPRITKSFIKLPLITVGENRSETVNKLASEIKRIENDSCAFTASYFVGYPWANVKRQGASALVITFNDQSLADSYAKELANRMWALRKEFQFPIYSIDEAVKIGLQSKKKPFILDELCDCTLGGGSGDVVTSIRYFIDNEIKNVVAVGIVDPEAVHKGINAGVGSTIKLSIGGKIYKKNNPPLDFEGKVKAIFENIVGDEDALSGMETMLGRIVVLERNSIDIILIEYPGKIGGPSFLKKLGINPREKKFIIVKEGLNPLVSYKGIAADILMVDTPGFDPQILKIEDYPDVPRPIYPFDPDLVWKA